MKKPAPPKLVKNHPLCRPPQVTASSIDIQERLAAHKKTCKACKPFVRSKDKTSKTLCPTYWKLCDPKVVEVLQLGQTGTWSPDRGKPGLAFIYFETDAVGEGNATIWVANCKCVDYGSCPTSWGLGFAAEVCANTASVVRRRRSTGG